MTQAQAPYKTIPQELQGSFDRALYFQQEATRNLWGVAEEAAFVVGRYTSATKELAAYISASVDTIEDYARAWKLYESMILAPYDDFREVSELRAALTISHFIVAGRLQDKYNADIYRVYSWLAECVESDTVRLSTKALAQIAEADMNKSGKVVDWRRYYVPRLQKIARQMLTFPDLPKPLQTVLLWVIEYQDEQESKNPRL